MGFDVCHVVDGSGTDATAVLDGFTIFGGRAHGQHSTPAFACPHGSSSLQQGGGMYIDAGSPTISNCTFVQNRAQADSGTFCCGGIARGGAVANLGGSPTLMACNFLQNGITGYGSPTGGAATGSGGAFYNQGGSPVLVGCLFAGNSAVAAAGAADYAEGGAVYSDGGQPVLIGCTFVGDNRVVASYYLPWARGGAVRATAGLLLSCTFLANRATCDYSSLSTAEGGALSGSATAINCLFRGNRAEITAMGSTSQVARGGAVCAAGSALVNCTLVGNMANSFSMVMGGGIYGAAEVQNSILWGNSQNGVVNESSQFAGPGPMSVNYSIVEGWTGSLGGAGNSGADPLFVAPPGDLHVQANSPAIDAGNNAAVPPDSADLDGDGDTSEPTPFDLDGNPRFLDMPSIPDAGVGPPPVVDIGAYEFEAPTAATIVSADPPNGHHDSLQNTTNSGMPQGIGVPGTPDEGTVGHYGAPQVTFSEVLMPPPTPASVAVSCTGGACPAVISVSGSGPTYTLTLSGQIPPLHCTTITFPGTAPGVKLQYASLPGDTNLDGVASTQDLLWLVQRMNDRTANLPANRARYNINRSNETGGVVINTQDLLRLVQLLNGTHATQAFNGANVAACP
jgi:hypothetical protein